jgi:hypothetical protein
MGARRHERFESDVTIRFDRGDGRMTNVSANGLYFVTQVALQIGEPLSITLEFETTELGVISAHCLARVIRVVDGGGTKGVGATLESIEFHRSPAPGPKDK